MANVGTAIAKSKAQRSEYLTFPKNIGKYGMLFMFSEYSFDSTNSKITATNATVSAGSVVLPLPTNGLAENSALGLADTELGLAGAAAASLSSGMAAGGDLGASFSKLANYENAEEAGGNSQTVLRAAVAAGKRNVAALGGQGLSSGIDAGLGSTMNNFTALTFNGVNLRSHQFNWRFFPEEASDSDTITQIRNTFQRAAHPEYENLLGGAGGGTVAGRALLRYPMLVKPIILIEGAEQYYYEFRPCLISSVSFTYKSESGMAFIKGGRPAAVDMSLNLKEASIWTKSDFGG